MRSITLGLGGERRWRGGLEGRFWSSSERRSASWSCSSSVRCSILQACAWRAREVETKVTGRGGEGLETWRTRRSCLKAFSLALKSTGRCCGRRDDLGGVLGEGQNASRPPLAGPVFDFKLWASFVVGQLHRPGVYSE